jgi:uncharacterized membrane protein YjjP (DUF1212 family)
MDNRSNFGASLAWGVAGAFLLHLVLVALAVAWVAFYSHILVTGHDQAFYEAHAQRSGPVVSLLAGGPAFFLAAAWLTRRSNGPLAAWIAAALYLVSDLAIMAAIGAFTLPAALVFLGGAAIKLAGTALGTRRAGA